MIRKKETWLKRASVFSAGVLLSACAALTSPDLDIQMALDQSRPDLAIHYFDQAFEQTAEADLASLFGYCDANLQLSRFRQADACLNQLESLIPGFQGDWADYQKAAAQSLRAAYWLALGQYQKAAELAEAAQQHLPALWDLRPYQTAGVARATLKDRPAALRHLQAIEAAITAEKPLLFDHAPFQQRHQQARFAIQIALNNYTAASAILQEQNQSDPWATQLVKGIGYGLMLGAGAAGDLSALQVLGEGVISELDIQAAARARSAFLKGQVAMANQQWAQAQGYFDQVLAEPLSQQMHELYFTSLQQRARIARQQGRLQAAEKWLAEALTHIEQQRATIHTDALKIGFIGNKQAVYNDMIALQVELKQAAQALHYVERAKARALVDLLANRPANATDTSSALWQQAELQNIDQLEQQSAELGQQLSGQSTQQRALVRKRQQALATQAPELSSLVQVNVPETAQMLAHLGADETLVEFYYDTNKLYVFVANREGVNVSVHPVANLEGELATFRRHLQEPQNQNYLASGKILYDRLFAPVAELLTGPNLLIVPHGALHYLPFAALPNGQQLLIDRHAIRVLPAASVQAFLAQRPTRAGQLLALGNPDLGNPQLDLPGTEQEIRLITGQYADARSLLRQDATETRLKTLAPRFGRLHIASHGVFEPNAPLQSALLLGKDSQNDGRLTVAELYDLPLSADLVVLSACETALNDLQNGDELVGFSRGFLYAGANAIVSSLWKVDDQATADLMSSFYQAEAQGYRKALQQAQQQTRQHYPHPYYWAAFQLTGGRP